MPKNLSFDEISSLVRNKLNEGRNYEQPRCYCYEVYPDYVIYRDEASTSPNLSRSYYTIDAQGNVTLTSTDEVRETKTYETVSPASFTLELEAVGVGKGKVRYHGKGFEAGDYPDKSFSISEAEQNQAAAEFTGPIKGNYEHKRGFLDGKLGELVGASTEGTALFVDYDVPAWLHNLTGGKLKVSLEWSRAAKRIVGVALTDNPRINDAELVAAFTDSENDSDDSVPERTGKKPMKKGLIQKIVAFFSGLSAEELADLESVETPTTGFTEDSDEVKALKAKNAELQAKLDKPATFTNGPRIAEAAANFAADLVSEDRVTPAEVDDLVATYTQLAEAEFSDKVEFSADGSTGLLASFVAREKKRPVLGLQSEKLKDRSIVTPTNETSTADFTKSDEFSRLMNLTDLGRRALALKTGN